jgi:hypothetical protein
MKSWRMSISWMMALVLFVALCIAAFRSLSAEASILAFSAMWAALIGGVLAWRYVRHRVFWHGFSIAGIAYALLAFAPGASTETRPYLATSLILDEIAVRLELPKRVGWRQFGGYYRGSTARIMAFPGLGGLDEGSRYERIGHSISAVVHGVGGGLVAMILAARGRKRIEVEEGG